MSNVDHPQHYNEYGVEAIDLIEFYSLGFHAGNAVKYLMRAPFKGKHKEDVEKALWYLERLRLRPFSILFPVMSKEHLEAIKDSPYQDVIWFICEGMTREALAMLMRVTPPSNSPGGGK